MSTSEAFTTTTSRRLPVTQKRAARELDALGRRWDYCGEHYVQIGNRPEWSGLVAVADDGGIHLAGRSGGILSVALGDITSAVLSGNALVISAPELDLRIAQRTADLVQALNAHRAGLVREPEKIAPPANKTWTKRRLADPLAALEVPGTVGGGAGPFGDLRVGDQVVLRFEGDSVFVEPANDRAKGTRVPYEALAEVVIAGPGVETSGGGFIGGGFGLEGAATGMLAATLLNAATTRSSVTSVVGLRAPGAELFVVHNNLTPDQLRLMLSPVFAALSGEPTWADQQAN